MKLQSKKKNKVTEKKVLKINKDNNQSLPKDNISDISSSDNNNQMPDEFTNSEMPSSNKQDTDNMPMPHDEINNKPQNDDSNMSDDSAIKGNDTSDIDDIYNQLSPEEKEATKSYAQSFLKNHSEESDESALNEKKYKIYTKKGNKLISNEDNN